MRSRICIWREIKVWKIQNADVGLRNKHNLNEEMILHGICLQQILVCSLVTNLDFHDKT